MSATAPLPLLPTTFTCSLPLDQTLTLLQDIKKLGDNLSREKSKQGKEKRSAKKPAPVIFMAKPDPSECEGGGKFY